MDNKQRIAQILMQSGGGDARFGVTPPMMAPGLAQRAPMLQMPQPAPQPQRGMEMPNSNLPASVQAPIPPDVAQRLNMTGGAPEGVYQQENAAAKFRNPNAGSPSDVAPPEDWRIRARPLGGFNPHGFKLTGTRRF